MRDLLLVALSSSVIFPPNPTPPHHPTKRSKPRPKPSSPAVPAPSRSSSTSAPSRPPLLSAVRCDLLAPRRRSHVKYYAGLASRLCEAGKLEEFLMVAESVLASGVEPSKFAGLLNAEALSAGFARALREGKVRSVVEVLSGVRGLGIRAVELFDSLATEALARECHRIVSGGEVEEVVDLMETLAGCHFSIKELVEPSDIIKVCVTRRNPDASVRYACIFPHVHVLFCNIIQEFGKKRDLLSALTVFKASKEKLNSPNMYIYRAIIDVCGLCGDHLQSRCIYEELFAQRITPNIYVFNSLMNVNAHDLTYTLYVYKHMQDLGVIPDMASYNILLKSCCVAARVDLAQDIYCEARNMESTGALKLDVFTYSTIIKVFADAKLWQMALKVKEDMLSAGVTPNIVTRSSLISACANAGLIEQATQLFEEMVLAGCEPNSQCCNILLHACVEACQYDRAFRLFQSWKESGFQNMFSEASNSRKDPLENSNTRMSNFRFNSHHLRFAMRVPFTPTTSTYNILMKACGTDYYRAKSLMDEMQTVGLSPNHISWSILMDVCGGLGNTEGAMQILRSMQETGIQPDVVAYTTAIKVCVESKNLKIAFSLYSEMKRYQIQPNLVTYNTLLRARSRYGSLQEVQQCLAIYQDMRKAGYKANDYYLKQLIEEWCEGVIQDSNQKKSPSSFCNIADIGKPQSLLLEKVAAHLQTSNTESLAIDLQGLTKVEARIVVLAVLRMIKEKHTPGDSINDDMSIIIGPSTAKNESEVEDAIIKLLQNDLALEVLLTGPRIALQQKMNLRNPFDSYPSLEDIMGRSELPRMLKSATRRPVVLHRLKVTRKSLYNWLKRRTGASRRRLY